MLDGRKNAARVWATCGKLRLQRCIGAVSGEGVSAIALLELKHRFILKIEVLISINVAEVTVAHILDANRIVFLIHNSVCGGIKFSGLNWEAVHWAGIDAVLSKSHRIDRKVSRRSSEQLTMRRELAI